MKRLLALLALCSSLALGQTTQFRASLVPFATSTLDLGAFNFIWDTAYVNYFKGATLSLSSTASITGAVTLSNLTASRLVATDGSKVLTSSITAGNLLSSVTGTTGTAGNLVFSASPAFTGTVTGAALNFTGAGTFGGAFTSGTTSPGEHRLKAATDVNHFFSASAGDARITFENDTRAAYIDLLISASTVTISDATQVTLAGDLAVNGDDLSSDGDLTIAPAGGDIISIAHISPYLTDTYDLGGSSLLWRSIWGSELNAIVFAENTISLLGGWFYVTHGQGTVEEDIDGSETAIDFGAGGNLAQNDFVVFRNNGQVEYMQIGTNVSGNTWNVTRNVDGSGANTWPQGTPYANFGQNGNGRVELNAYDTPRLSVIQQGGSYNSQTEVIRLGDLNGNWGYSAQTWGFGVGKYASGYNSITVDTSNGVRFFNGTGVVGQLTTSTWTLGNTSTEHVAITSTDIQFKDGAQIYTQLSAGQITLGETSGGEYLTLDGTDGLKLYGGGVNTVQLSNTGLLTLKSSNATSRVEISNDSLLYYVSGSALVNLGTNVSGGYPGLKINNGVGYIGKSTSYSYGLYLDATGNQTSYPLWVNVNSTATSGSVGGGYMIVDADANTGNTVYGWDVSAYSKTGNAYGGKFYAQNTTTSGYAWAVRGETGGSGSTEQYGVQGYAAGASTTNYGIYGSAENATNNYSGYFNAGITHVQTGLQIGGTPSATTRYISHMFIESGTVDIASTGGSAVSTAVSMTVTGASTGDVVIVQPDNTILTSINGHYIGYVNSANTVYIQFVNNSTGTIDPPSGTVKVIVLRGVDQ